MRPSQNGRVNGRASLCDGHHFLELLLRAISFALQDRRNRQTVLCARRIRMACQNRAENRLRRRAIFQRDLPVAFGKIAIERRLGGRRRF